MPRRSRRPPPPEPTVSHGTVCWLCARPLGARTEAHHPRPKSEGGRATVPVHPICHRALHASFSNKDLARMERHGETPAAHPALQPFLRFVARKAPDFHAPTRARRREADAPTLPRAGKMR